MVTRVEAQPVAGTTILSANHQHPSSYLTIALVRDKPLGRNVSRAHESITTSCGRTPSASHAASQRSRTTAHKHRVAPAFPTTDGVIDLRLSHNLLDYVTATPGSPVTAVANRWQELNTLALTRIDTLEAQLDDLVAEVYTLTEAKITAQNTATSVHHQLWLLRTRNAILETENAALRQAAPEIPAAQERVEDANRGTHRLQTQLDRTRMEAQGTPQTPTDAPATIIKTEGDYTEMLQSAVERISEVAGLRMRAADLEHDRDLWKSRAQCTPQIVDLKRRLTESQQAQKSSRARAKNIMRGLREERERGDHHARKASEFHLEARSCIREINAMQHEEREAWGKRKAWYFELRVRINRIFEVEPEVTREAVDRILDEMVRADLSAGITFAERRRRA